MEKEIISYWRSEPSEGKSLSRESAGETDTCSRLCCMINPYIECYYCREGWCYECWDVFTGNPWRGSTCKKGKFLRYSYGGHFTLMYGYVPWNKEEIEKHRFGKNFKKSV